MSLPSFKVSKVGKVWRARGKLPGGRPFDIECGDGSEGSARKIAEREIGRRAQLAEASRIRWRKFHAAKNAAPTETGGELPDDIDEQLEHQDADDEPTPTERPAPAAPPPRDNESIRAKLLSIGDAVQPDDVIPPGEKDEPDNDPIDDDETPQLIADIIAGGVVNWHTRAITKRLKKAKPPRSPGEPHERMLAWEHEGIAHNCKKLVGRSAALGPTGKMLVGVVVVTAQMYLESEAIEGTAAAAPEKPAPPPAAEPDARGNANGTPTDAAKGSFDGKPAAPALSLVKKNPGLGTFGK